MCKSKLITESQNFEAHDVSNWKLKSVDLLQIRINKYNPMRASSYIDLTEKLKCKKAYINIKNEDQKCFLWSILAALHPQEKDPQRVTKYKQFEHIFDEVFQFFLYFIARICNYEKFYGTNNCLKGLN